jgi:magnesium transporter
MIAYFRSSSGKLVSVPDFVPGCWVDVCAPTPHELESLHDALDIPLDFLQYPLDVDERPRYEHEDGVSLIVLQTPYYLGESSDIPYDTQTLGIIHTGNAIVSVSAQENAVLRDIRNGVVRNISSVKKNRFTLQIFLRTAQRYLIDLKQINRMVDATEDRLESSTRNKELLELLKQEKSLVYFMTALKANELMMEKIKRERVFEMYPDDQDLLNDVLVENLQAIEMTDIASKILSSMTATFASVISNNLNVVMKFLASVTILVSVPTLIASLYGMNVELPMQQNPGAFWIIAGCALSLVVLLLGVFVKKGWF